MKKLISSILIPSLIIYLTGCYSVHEISKDDLTKKKKYRKLIVHTKTLENYEFENEWFHIESDTLYGNGAKLIENFKIPFSGKIALDNIYSFEVEGKDGVGTLILTLAVIGGLVLLAYTFFMAKSFEKVLSY